MGTVEIRFYAELNDLLPRSLRGGTVDVDLAGSASVKDVVERHGVPHTAGPVHALRSLQRGGGADREGLGDRDAPASYSPSPPPVLAVQPM